MGAAAVLKFHVSVTPSLELCSEVSDKVTILYLIPETDTLTLKYWYNTCFWIFPNHRFMIYATKLRV